MRNLFRKSMTATVLSCYVATASFQATADDTEIYFGVGVNTAAKPNVLFILDDSGSMNTMVYDEKGNALGTRMEIVRNGFVSLMDKLTNINVGLMNFSAASNNTNGGPVLYPVKDIDSPAEQQVILSISNNDDDAYQNASTVVTNTTYLPIGNVAGPQCTGCIETFANNTISVSTDNIERNSTTSTNLTLGRDNNPIGFRFPNIDIPSSARIIDAYLVLTTRSLDTAQCSNSNSLGAVNVEVRVEDRSNPATYVNGTTIPNTNHPVYDAAVLWSMPSQTSYATNAQLISPNIAPLVQAAIGRSGWSSGNAVAFQISELAGNDGCRDVYSFSSGTAATRPQLQIRWASSSDDSLLGLRFNGVNIPQGAKITSARLEVAPFGPSNDSATVNVFGELADSSQPFTSATLDSRSLTSNDVDWALPVWTTNGLSQTSPDISDVVEEIVGQPGWCGGNSLSLLMKGAGIRSIYAREANANREAKLNISYIADDSATTGCQLTTVTSSIVKGADDIEQGNNGVIYPNDADIDVYKDQGSITVPRNDAVALRFEHVNLPIGADVSSIEQATLTLTAANNAGASSTTTISGVTDATLDSLPTAANSLTDGTLSPTAASVAWTISGWTNNVTYNSPDLKNIIRELIDHGSWKGNNSGNNITLLLKGSTGEFAARSREGAAASAAVLTIRYKGRYHAAASATVRSSLKNIAQQLQPNSYTPYSGVLYEAARYFNGGNVYFGKQRGVSGGPSENFRISNPIAVTGATHNLPTGCASTYSNNASCKTETLSGTAKYISPIVDKCQSNHLVFLTDGEPNSNSSTTATLVQGLTGNSCSGTSDGKDCSRKIVQWLISGQTGTGDVISTVPEKQFVKTHTIGFALTIPFLEELAALGDGKYTYANSTSTLEAAFNDIIRSVKEDDTTFVSAGVTVNQYNRLTHNDELYFALFRPDSGTKWLGNVKKYKLTGNNIVDANTNLAIDPDTGKFFGTTQSYWSTNVDGNDVGLGGAAEHLPSPATRKIYTNVSTSDPNTLTATGNAFNKLNGNITSGMLGAVDTADRAKILDWARGYDVNDSTSPTDPRYSYGDPLHSRPQLIIYDDASTDNRTLVFASTNEGFLHAVESDTGSEAWSFIPKELLKNLTHFQKNTPAATRVNGLDGFITPYVIDNNANGIVDGTDKAYLMVGMRRGGFNFYMLDVTDPDAPKLLYVRGKDTSYGAAYPGMGESWSQPVFGKIKLNGVLKDVAFVTAGYSSEQDNYGAYNPSGDSVGNNVYIIDALTGDLIWEKADVINATGVGTVSANMKWSMPSGVAAIDLKGSGLIEKFYVADMHGQVFRFDVNNAATSKADLVTGGRIARIAGTDEANNRRFFNRPDIALVPRPNGKSYLAVSIGSGYRAHPKDTAIKDRFYSFRDVGALKSKFTDDILESQMLNITGYKPGDTIGGKSIVQHIDDADLKGWYLDLSSTSGEKVLSESVTFGSSVVFTSYLPQGNDLCAGQLGNSRTYVVDLLDGTGELQNGSRYVENERAGIAPDPLVMITPDPKLLVGTEVIRPDTDGDGDPDDPLKQIKFCEKDVCAVKWQQRPNN